MAERRQRRGHAPGQGHQPGPRPLRSALGPFSSRPGGLTLAGSRLLFSADDVVLGRELWAGRASILAGRPDRAIEELGEEVEEAGLPSGIERSLMSKLRAAAEALGRRDGNRAATRLLQAFVQELERLGASASLLEFAQEILDLLAEEVSVYSVPSEERGSSRTG